MSIRKPHAVLDIKTRALKAKKILAILGLETKGIENFRLLEIGTGSGGIAHYFANYCDGVFSVDAVDVVDSRLVREGYHFQLVNDVRLPFESSTFDVVITNHVIEHVGSREFQIKHLEEIRRVMKPEAVSYLAVPNRWMLVEPHYQLIFLSWLPLKWRTPYLKWMRKGEFYDCEPLEKGELESMLASCGFQYKNRCVDALKLTFELEKKESKATALVSRTPSRLLELFTGVIPTLIYTVRKSNGSSN